MIYPTAANIAGSNDTATSVVTSSGNATDLAFFATDRFYFTPEISVIGGVRVDRYIADLYRRHGGHGGDRAADHDGQVAPTLVNPRAALVWEPSEDQTYYFSYGKSSVPQGTSVVGSPTPITTANQALDPELSETLEIGAKKSFFDGALGLSGRVFKVLKSNALITDPVSGTATAQSGERDRVQGLELSATGQITDKWNVLGAYTFLDSKVTSDNFCTTTTRGLQAQSLHHRHPGHLRAQERGFSLWRPTSWTISCRAWGSAAARSISPSCMCGTPPPAPRPIPTGLSRIAVIPRTLEFDTVATYDIDRYHFQFNVNNLTDELNYTQSFGNRGTPSAGRTFIFSVGVKL